VYACISLLGCVSTRDTAVFLEHKIESPKILAMSGSRAPWVYEIEKRLKKRGFTIKRMASQNVAVERVSDDKIEQYNEATARYIMRIEGYAPNDKMRRCIGGGWNFEFINVELIDVVTNETVMYYSNSGYSEGCQPLSGTIFSDIENSVSGLWSR
jgi:hypothetical protein